MKIKMRVMMVATIIMIIGGWAEDVDEDDDGVGLRVMMMT